jgi:hypothetical protein
MEGLIEILGRNKECSERHKLERISFRIEISNLISDLIGNFDFELSA